MRDVPDGTEEAIVVESVDPARGRHFHRQSVWPCSLPTADLGFVEAIDRLGQGIVIAVADAADRRHQLGFGKVT